MTNICIGLKSMVEEYVKEKVERYIKNTPFYASDIRYSCKNWEEYPILEKATVNKHMDMFNIDYIKHMHTRSSGSSGQITNTYWDEMEYLRSLGHLWRIRKQYGISPKDKYCTAHVNYETKERILNSKVVINRNCLSICKLYIDDESLARYVSEIEQFQPRWMIVPPSFLLAVLNYVVRSKSRLPETIVLIELNGEFCTQGMMLKVREILPNVNVVNMYGMQECNGIAYGNSNILKVIEKNVFVETIDKSNRSVFGIEGDIIITTLSNSVMPFIRYKTGDKGILDKEGNLILTSCRCNDSLEINGVSYDGAIFWNIVENMNFSFCNGAIKWFTVIYENNELTFKLIIDQTARSIDTQEIRSWLIEFIHNYYCWNIEIRVESVNAIDNRVNSNKIKYFINRNI